jgi:hypothetical protein
MRDPADFSSVLREAAWFFGCVMAAIAVSEFVEDKSNQTPIVSVAFYLLSGVVRYAIRAWRTRER